jgi:hypothetical protein
MKVIGIRTELEQAAMAHCSGAYRTWCIMLAREDFRDWDHLRERFPGLIRIDQTEAHFPLLKNGLGMRARVYFDMKVLRVHEFAPAPAKVRAERRPDALPSLS